MRTPDLKPADASPAVGRSVRRASFAATILPLTLILCMGLAAGCAHTHPHDLILDLPFHRQSPHECGLAALRMVLDFHNVPYDSDRLRARVFIPSLPGTLASVIADEACSIGLSASVRSATVPELREALLQRCPPLVLLAPANPDDAGHIAVVSGIAHDDRTIYLQDGNRRRTRTTILEFTNRWHKANCTTIFLAPAIPKQPEGRQR